MIYHCEAMLPAPKFDNISQTLQNDPVSLVGLLFAPLFTKVGGEGIIPRLGYLNSRTGKSMHFFCAGYSGYNHDPGAQQLGDVRYEDGVKIPWAFSEADFAEFVDEMEHQTSWTYSGEADLILVEPEFGFSGQPPTLRFDQAMVFDIDAMINDGTLDHSSRLFEAIIRYARTLSNPSASDFSNRRGARIIGEAAFDAIVSWLPDFAGTVLRRGLHYRVRSIER